MCWRSTIRRRRSPRRRRSRPSAACGCAPTERPGFFANLKGALKPGGLLLMQGYRPEQMKYRTGGPPDAERLLTRAMLEHGFGDMAELDIREHDSAISEGTAHVGLSALIDLVARK